MFRTVWAGCLCGIVLSSSATAAEKFPIFQQIVPETSVGLCLREDVQRELKLSEIDVQEMAKIAYTFGLKYNDQLKKLDSLDSEVAWAEHKKLVLAMAQEIAK